MSEPLLDDPKFRRFVETIAGIFFVYCVLLGISTVWLLTNIVVAIFSIPFFIYTTILGLQAWRFIAVTDPWFSVKRKKPEMERDLLLTHTYRGGNNPYVLWGSYVLDDEGFPVFLQSDGDPEPLENVTAWMYVPKAYEASK